MFNENYQWCDSVERQYAEEQRARRRDAPNLTERREAEEGKYAAYRRACKGLYAHDTLLQDPESKEVSPPTWEPDKSETWEWFWHLINHQREALLRGESAQCFLPEPTVMPLPEKWPDGIVGEITMKRVGLKLERFNFQKIDDLLPEKGNIVRLADSLATANLTEYLEKQCSK